MTRRQPALSGAALAVGVAVSILIAGCGGGSGEEALQQAREEALSAEYLVVSQPGGRQLLFGPELTVIKQRGRVLAWVAANEEFTPKANKGCYERYTEFNRDDVPDQREGVMPPDVGGVSAEESNGGRVLVGREKHMDYADTEFEAHLDDNGHLVRTRVRSAEFGVLPASRWRTTEYSYPTAERFARMAGSSPRPRCN